MPLSVKSRVENEIGILDLEGALTLGPSLRLLREAARDVLSKGQLLGLIVAVEKVTAADSAGLGELTIVYTYTSNHKCGIALAAVSASLRTMLEVTRLDGLLPVAENVEAAKKLIKHR